MAHSAKIILREDATRKDGKAPFCLRITINRRVKLITLNQHLEPKNWDPISGRVKPGAGNAQKLNFWLQKMSAKAADIFYKYDMENKTITLSLFSTEWHKKGETLCFFEFAKKLIQQKKLSLSTRQQYLHLLNKLKRYKPQIFLPDIDYRFLADYEYYMRNNLSNDQNTIYKNIKFLRTVILEGIRREYISNNPFNKYKIKWKKTKRTILTLPEIEILKNLTLPDQLANTNEYFLFCIYTGLRYSDILKLSWDHIHSDTIIMATQKTGTPIYVPLSDNAKKILQDRKSKTTGKRIFQVNCNQTTNRNLKKIMETAEIKKNISFHCARHTFATISLNLGIPLETVGELLGHEDLKTTKIYAKLLATTLKTEMNKWNNLETQKN